MLLLDIVTGLTTVYSELHGLRLWLCYHFEDWIGICERKGNGKGKESRHVAVFIKRRKIFSADYFAGYGLDGGDLYLMTGAGCFAVAA